MNGQPMESALNEFFSEAEEQLQRIFASRSEWVQEMLQLHGPVVQLALRQITGNCLLMCEYRDKENRYLFV